MTLVNDPDNLDRYQVLLDPVLKTISIRGWETVRVPAVATGDTPGGNFFQDAGADYVTSGVTSGDILAILSDPADDGSIIGHYKVFQVIGNSGLKVDRSIINSTAANLSYKIGVGNPTLGSLTPAVYDGVTMQALYSFLKEEWRTNSIGTSGEDLIKYTFPIVSITSEQFEVGGINNENWEFTRDSGDGPDANESPRNLIRTGGWASINTSGEIINNYPSIITLGSLDADAQVYYQLTSATTTPQNFVLTGTVNQSIKTLEVTGGSTLDGLKTPVGRVTGNITFTTSQIVDNNTADLGAAGYASGDKVQVRRANNALNIGIFEIQSIGPSNVLGINATLSADANDPTAILSPVTDNRDYLVLRVRKKSRSYAQSEIADIGVSQINTIVNRFPLAHVIDPAIVLQDGQLSGDGTATTTSFQDVETHTSGSDGVTSVELNSSFTFTSAGSTFNDGALRSGDSLQLTSGSDVGYFEITSIDSATQLTCFIEPAGLTTIPDNVPFTGGEGTLSFVVRTGTRDSGSASGTFNYTAGATTATLTNAGKTFTTDDGLGSRTVVVGDMVVLTVTNGNTAAIGVYKVSSVDSATQLTLDATDLQYGVPTISGSTVTYIVLRPGMHLQYLSKASSSLIAGTDVTSFIFGNATNTIQVDDPTNEDWNTDYNYYIGGTITVTGAAISANNGTYVITNITTTGTTDDTLSVVNVDGTTVSFTSSTDTVASVVGEYGFIRDLNSILYSFNWRLLGNDGSLAECFQYLQRELRRAADIDESSSTSRGDITDLLMIYTAPNGTTLNLFIDNLSATEFNNVTKQDLTGNSRNFAFLAGLTITLNDNILNAATAKVVVFFTNPTGAAGDEFGTPGAIIIDDKDGVDMVSLDPASSPLLFTFDYTNNAQGGRTPGTAANITVVCITDDTGQYVSATNTIQQVNNTTVALVAGLERNYSNP